MNKQKTFMQRAEDVTREWHLVDVKGKILGRIATQIAKKLIGKHKTTYTPHIDSGDFVVVINAADITLSRNKNEKKVYRKHSGFPGSLKELTFEELKTSNPEKIIKLAVKNMLPKNRLRKQRMARLKVYAGSEHKHQSQLGK